MSNPDFRCEKCGSYYDKYEIDGHVCTPPEQRTAPLTREEWRARTEKAEAAVVSAAGRILTLECSVANAEARAERAEALLREGEAFDRGEWCDVPGCTCGNSMWRAKVRDLLEAP